MGILIPNFTQHADKATAKVAVGADEENAEENVEENAEENAVLLISTHPRWMPNSCLVKVRDIDNLNLGVTTDTFFDILAKYTVANFIMDGARVFGDEAAKKIRDAICDLPLLTELTPPLVDENGVISGSEMVPTNLRIIKIIYSPFFM